MKRVYLATPYTDENPDIQEYRYRVVTRVAAKLMGDGLHIYSPISHTHPIAKMGKLPGDWEYWKSYCECYFDGWTQEMYVLMLPGWDTSTGVTAEIALAESLDIPITYIDPLTFEYPHESAWTGKYDSDGMMVFIGDMIRTEVEINTKLHGNWAFYRITWGSEYNDEQKQPWAFYENSSRGQVIPKGTNQGLLDIFYNDAPDDDKAPLNKLHVMS